MKIGRDGDAVAREARRRAAVLDRYVALERPTAFDDAETASELGLAVDTMIRLANSWRRQRDETLLVGRATALARRGKASEAEIMAEDVDLEGVRADRRDELTRRIRIIQRHLASAARGVDDTAASAAEMGVSPQRFIRLTQAWVLQARPDAMPGAMRSGTPWRRQPERLRRTALLREALADADPEAPLSAAYAAFVAACNGEGLKPLSRPRFYALAKEQGAVRQVRSAEDG